MYPNQPVKSVVDSIHLTHWTIGEFKLVFLFSERILTEIKKLSCLPNWYEDPITAATYIDRLNTCFISNCFQLFFDYFFGDSGFPLLERFSYAQDRYELATLSSNIFFYDDVCLPL